MIKRGSYMSIKFATRVALLFMILSISSLFADKALVTHAKGQVSFIRNSKTAALLANEILQSGDTVVTGVTGEATIQFASKTICRIGPGTKVKISELSGNGTQVKMDLTNGSVVSRVQKNTAKDNYVVQTPTAIAGVRGTDFIAEADKNGESKILVDQGSVGVTSLKSGNESVAEQGQAIVADHQGLKSRIMEEFEKGKFAILEEMEKQKKANFEAIIKEKEKHKILLDEQKQKQNEFKPVP